MEGNDLFSRKYKGREYVITAKDRMGNAIDYVRAVRTNEYLYVKNYLTDRPLYQPHTGMDMLLLSHLGNYMKRTN